MNERYFQRLRLSVGFEIDAFQSRLTQLLAADYPTGVGPDLIEQISSDLTQQQKVLDEIAADYPYDPKGSGDRLRSEHRKLIARLPLIVSLENAQTRKVPWSLVPGIESFARVLMPDKKLLTSALEDLNYTIKWYPTGTEDQGIARFSILELPAIHRLNVYAHILVGHELFHPLLSEFFDRTQRDAVDRLRAACDKYLDSQPSLGSLFDRNRRDQIVETTRVIWRRALEELMCDMGCSAVFGPAGLFSLLGFAIGFSWDEMPSAPGFYPSFRFRLRTVLRHAFDDGNGKLALSQLGKSLIENDLSPFSDQMNAELHTLREEVASRADISVLNSDPLMKIAYDEVEQGLALAWQYVERIASSVPGPWIVTYGEVASHLHSLQMRVPPSEIKHAGEIVGRGASLSAIAVAAWLYETRCNATRGTQPISDAIEEFKTSCRLLLKAFEDAELIRSFQHGLKRQG